MEMAGQRWLKFRAFLAEQRLQAGEIHAVYYEDVKQHAGTLAAHVYGGFLACLEMWCAANNVPLRPVGVGGQEALDRQGQRRQAGHGRGRARQGLPPEGQQRGRRAGDPVAGPLARAAAGGRVITTAVVVWLVASPVVGALAGRFISVGMRSSKGRFCASRNDLPIFLRITQITHTISCSQAVKFPNSND
jgi:hypothetical protein